MSSISLIIPAYNEERLLGDTLETALRYGKGRFKEIIVVDNASSDRTEEIARAYPGVTIIHEVVKGPGPARQRGARRATADILAFIDADTRMTSGWPETIEREFAKDPEVVAVSGPCLYYDAPPLQRAIMHLYWYIVVVPYAALTGHMLMGSNFAMRRDAFDRVGGFDLSIPFFGEDIDLGRRAKTLGKVKFVPSLVVHTSNRRFARNGFLRTAMIYITNYFSQIFLRTSITKRYEDFR